MNQYKPNIIEKKWQEVWDKNKTYKAAHVSKKKKFYVLEMFPYPSGKIHMGHLRNYTIGDVTSRFYMLQNYNVMHPMGWDSFGMPAENAAIENNIKPKDWTQKNINNMKTELMKIGLSIDWDREISTCNQNYYKHQQKLFIDFFNNGLVYKKDSFVNWDPIDKTVLANEQVIDGRGWRSGALVEKKKLSQWFLNISKFSHELLNDLESLDAWPEKVKLMQRNWIGLSKGAEIKFKLLNSDSFINVFTTRPETVFGASFIGLSVEHPLSSRFQKNIKFLNFREKCLKLQEKREFDEEKLGFDTGLFVEHPFLKNYEIPVFFSNYVLVNYGRGAIFGCPAHDERDFEFAKNHNLKIKNIIKNTINELPYCESNHGDKITNSQFLDGLNISSAKKKIIEKLKEVGVGKETSTFRLKDWGISRQRYWGCPIPILYRDDGQTIPVDEKDLPVILPEEVDFLSSGNPLDKINEWKYTECSKTGQKAIRETDTLDTFFDSSWYFLRFCSPESTDVPFNEKDTSYWMPVDHYIGGIEHAILHLLYSRFFLRALKHCGYKLPKEPFKKLITQGMVCHETFRSKENQWFEPATVMYEKNKYWIKSPNGKKEVFKGRSEKMSKSKKNIVDPGPIISEYGADTARLFMISDSPPERDLEWSIDGIKATHKYLDKIFVFLANKLTFSTDIKNLNNINDEEKRIYIFVNTSIENFSNDIKNYRFNTAVAKLRELSNTLLKSKLNKEMFDFSWSIYLRLIYIIIPHFAQELASKSGLTCLLDELEWPVSDKKISENKSVSMVIQINGKKKSLISIPKDIDKDSLIETLKSTNLKEDIIGKKIKKVIFIPNKIINFVI